MVLLLLVICSSAIMHGAANNESQRANNHPIKDVPVVDEELKLHRTDLHCAAMNGEICRVQRLLELGRDNPRTVDDWGFTAVDLAIEFKRWEVVRVLERYNYKKSNAL